MKDFAYGMLVGLVMIGITILVGCGNYEAEAQKSRERQQQRAKEGAKSMVPSRASNVNVLEHRANPDKSNGVTYLTFTLEIGGKTSNYLMAVAQTHNAYYIVSMTKTD